jgi:hypothetical protein
MPKNTNVSSELVAASDECPPSTLLFETNVLETFGKCWPRHNIAKPIPGGFSENNI